MTTATSGVIRRFAVYENTFVFTNSSCSPTFQAFQLTMLLKTGVTMRVPELDVVPP